MKGRWFLLLATLLGCVSPGEQPREQASEQLQVFINDFSPDRRFGRRSAVDDLSKVSFQQL